MKIVRISLLSFVCAVLIIMASSFSAKRFTTITYLYNQTFTMGTVNSDPLDDVSKWEIIPSYPGCTGSVKICSIVITNIPGQSMPSLQTIINHIRAQYDANGATFSSNEIVEIFVSGVKVAEALVKMHN